MGGWGCSGRAAVEYPLRAQIWDNGVEDFSDIDNNNYDDSGGLDSELPAIIERPGTRLSEDEVADLHDLLGHQVSIREPGCGGCSA